MSSSALRVAVTRDEAPGGPLALALRRHGMAPVSCPAVVERPPLDPEPLQHAACDLERRHWLVVASARAVSALMAARDGRLLPPGLRTAAVGNRTAEALIVAGADSPLVAPRAGAQPLVEALWVADRWPARRVVLPRAAEGRRELGEALREMGAEVAEVIAYRTLARSCEEIAESWRRARPEAVVVTSPSAARALAAALGTESLRRLRAVVAIGATTAATLEGMGIRALVSARADFDALATRLASARERRCEESRS